VRGAASPPFGRTKHYLTGWRDAQSKRR
jgi:hypothetical protein